VKIALIDDNPDHRELAEARLRRTYPDADILHVVRQRDLDRMLEGDPVDVVLTDYRLHWSDGLKILEQVLRRRPGTPVIMVTDTGSEEIATEGLKAGLADYVLKGHLHRLPLAVGESLEKKRLREAHEDVVERYRIVSELSSDYAYGFRIEPDGCFVREWTTHAFTRITGYLAEELDTGVLLPLAHPEDRRLVEVGRERLRAGEPYICELRIVTKDGQIRWLRDSARPIWDEAHTRVVRVLGAGQDITDRKVAEAHREELIAEQAARAAAEAGERRYRSLAEAIPQIVFTLNADGRADFFNRRWFDFTGLDEERSYGLQFEGVIHTEDIAANDAAWRHALAAGETFTGEFRLRRTADTSWRWQLVRAVPLRDESGRVVKWFGTSTDIEDQKRSQDSYREAQRLESIGLLAGGIAHDFNNLLTGVMGHISLALDELPEDSRPKSYLEYAMRASERAADLTRQLLAYSGKGRFFIEAVNLSTVVRDIGSLLESSIPKKVELDLQLAPNLPPIEADVTQIQQLVMNMVINGAEAIGEDRPGVVRVTTSLQDVDEEHLREGGFALNGIAPGKYVSIEVLDTGCGMTDDVKARIFDPFFTTKFTGRGLGMSAALGIVRGHKGAIQVQSEPGKGSRFRILLPLPEECARDASPQDEAAGADTVLVVDDEETVRGTAVAMLERCGYRVVTANDGRAALDIFCAAPGRFTLVLLDLTMPVMGGREVLEEMKRIRPDVVVIASSGYSEDIAMQHFPARDVAGFIQKPYNTEMLQTKVREALESSEGATNRGGEGATSPTPPLAHSPPRP
jgi:PAS domain S-box-containing protein